MNQRIDFPYLFLRVLRLAGPLTAKYIFDNWAVCAGAMVTSVVLILFKVLWPLSILWSLFLGWLAMNLRPSMSPKSVTYIVKRFYYAIFLLAAFSFDRPYLFLLIISLLALFLWLYEDLPSYQKKIKSFGNPVLVISLLFFLLIPCGLLYVGSYLISSVLFILPISFVHICLYSYWYTILTREYYEPVIGGY